VSGESDYWLYEGETTVSGNGYMRYVVKFLSPPASLPGAMSDSWEF
jgi:hypothetical protein